MRDHGRLFCREHNGQRGESALGKYQIGRDLAQYFFRVADTFDQLYGNSEIFQYRVASQLNGVNTVERNVPLLAQRLFYAVSADVYAIVLAAQTFY